MLFYIAIVTKISNLNGTKADIIIGLSDKMLSTAFILPKNWKESNQQIICEIMFPSNVKRTFIDSNSDVQGVIRGQP